MTAQEFNIRFFNLTEENKIIVRDTCMREMPVSYSSFYRKLNKCTWSNAELLLIETYIIFDIYNEDGIIKTLKTKKV